MPVGYQPGNFSLAAYSPQMFPFKDTRSYLPSLKQEGPNDWLSRLEADSTKGANSEYLTPETAASAYGAQAPAAQPQPQVQAQTIPPILGGTRSNRSQPLPVYGPGGIPTNFAPTKEPAAAPGIPNILRGSRVDTPAAAEPGLFESLLSSINKPGFGPQMTPILTQRIPVGNRGSASISPTVGRDANGQTQYGTQFGYNHSLSPDNSVGITGDTEGNYGVRGSHDFGGGLSGGLNAGVNSEGQPIIGAGMGYNRDIGGPVLGGQFHGGVNAGVGYNTTTGAIGPSLGVGAGYQRGDVGVGAGYGTGGLTGSLQIGRGQGAQAGGGIGNTVGQIFAGPLGGFVGSGIGSGLGSAIDSLTGSRYRKNKQEREQIQDVSQSGENPLVDSNNLAALSSGAQWTFDPSGGTKWTDSAGNERFSWELDPNREKENSATVAALNPLGFLLSGGQRQHGGAEAMTGWLANLAQSKGDVTQNIKEIYQRYGLTHEKAYAGVNQLREQGLLDSGTADAFLNGLDQLFGAGAYASGGRAAPASNQPALPNKIAR